ncbi:MAG: hypothetical protein FJW14_09995 [Acidimicrobiia bacterium]|nr:hypothetical protein [Acidimicrobiia bacterium]
MRKLIAGALCVAVQMAGLGAPLTHAHPDDHATEHHDAPTVHTHWSGHGHSHRPSEAPALDADDHDRAVFLNVFAAVAAAALPAPATPSDVFDLIVPPEQAAHRAVSVVHGHDPPLVESLPARAPPALLS